MSRSKPHSGDRLLDAAERVADAAVALCDAFELLHTAGDRYSVPTGHLYVAADHLAQHMLDDVSDSGLVDEPLPFVIMEGD